MKKEETYTYPDISEMDSSDIEWRRQRIQELCENDEISKEEYEARDALIDLILHERRKRYTIKIGKKK